MITEHTLFDFNCSVFLFFPLGSPNAEIHLLLPRERRYERRAPPGPDQWLFLKFCLVPRGSNSRRTPKCSPQSLSGVVALETVYSFRVCRRKGRERARVRAQESRLPASAVGCRPAKEAEVEGKEGRAGLGREPIGRGRPVASRYWAGAVVRQPALRAADRIAGSLAPAGSRWEGSRSRLAERAAPRLAERGPEQGGAADDGRRQVWEIRASGTPEHGGRKAGVGADDRACALWGAATGPALP